MKRGKPWTWKQKPLVKRPIPKRSSIKRVVQSVLNNTRNTEYKTIDTAITNAYETAGTITLLNGTTSSAQETGRDGNVIVGKSGQLRDYSRNKVNSLQRMLLVIDRMPNGVLPAITDILMTATIDSLRNLDNRSRFNIVYDKVMKLTQTTPDADDNEIVNFTSYYRKMNLKVTYNNTDTGGIDNIVSGALYLIQIGTSGTSNASTTNARVRFTD